MEMGMSESTVNRRVKTLKKKILKVIWHFLEMN
jgi:DNA-binding Lrp family transcriptional regulator